jgi:hypothetical protein
MNTESTDPRKQNGRKSGYQNEPDSTPRREGGDDSLAETSPTDSRADEKVIVNEQRENKTVNVPSQTAVNTSEQTGNDEEVM